MHSILDSEFSVTDVSRELKVFGYRPYCMTNGPAHTLHVATHCPWLTRGPKEACGTPMVVLRVVGGFALIAVLTAGVRQGVLHLCWS